MKKIFVLPLLPACTALFIFGYKNPEYRLRARCMLGTTIQPQISDLCSIQRQEKIVNALQENLDKHENQLIEYNKEYDLYSHQLIIELSSGASSLTLHDLEQYIYQNKLAKDLFNRLVVLDSNLIPSAKYTISSNRSITLDLEQSIWLLKQKNVQPGFSIPKKDVNRIEYLIQQGEVASRFKLITVGGENVAESKEKILNEIKASLES